MTARWHAALESLILAVALGVGIVGMIGIGYEMGQQVAAKKTADAPCVEPVHPPQAGGVVMTFCP